MLNSDQYIILHVFARSKATKQSQHVDILDEYEIGLRPSLAATVIHRTADSLAMTIKCGFGLAMTSLNTN